MPLTLCRIDDRLIHGQVVLGWGAPLGVDLIVLVDEAVRDNAWEREIYRMAVPQGVEVEFLGADEAGSRLREWADGHRRVFVLTGDIATMERLVERGDGAITRINLGGVHRQPGRRERLRYLYLSEDEVDRLRKLAESGVHVTAQDVPTAMPVTLQALLG